MEKLTELKVKNSKPRENEYYIREGRGLVLRVRPSGAKSFYYIFDLNGKRCRMLLGQYPLVSLSEARTKHLDALLTVGRGEDPRVVVSPEQTPIPEELTVQTLASLWAEWSKDNHTVKWANTLSLTLKKDFLPSYGNRLASEIRRRDAVAILEAKAKDTPGQATNLHKALRGMWQYALERELVEFNPFAELKASRVIPAMKQKSRARVLSDHEIRILWREIDNGGGSDSTKQALKISLVIGQRIGEVCGMHAREIQIGVGKPYCKKCRRCGWWTIPAIRRQGNKGGEHRVYLTPLALKLIGERQEYIFPGDTDNQPISPNSINHHVRREVSFSGKTPYYGMARWTPHDLRRTCSTGVRRLGASRDSMNLILGHVVGGVTGVYDRYEGDEEKERWLISWSQHLEKIIEES